MSLAVVIKGTEGVVLAADSRVTLTAQRQGGETFPVNFDNATKLLSFSKPHNFVGVATYGQAVIGTRTAHSLIPELEVELEDQGRMEVQEYAARIGTFFLAQWVAAQMPEGNVPGMLFIVGGYDPGAPYGKVFLIDVPNHPEPVEQSMGDTNFGMTWGGQLQIASRIIHGYDPKLRSILKDQLHLDDAQVDRVIAAIKDTTEFAIPYQVLPLQDCVDLAAFMVRTTADAQNLAIDLRGVGGLIEVAVITRLNGLEYLQKKTLKITDGRK